jgi:methyl-accepting chemotaxis protein WspA
MSRRSILPHSLAGRLAFWFLLITLIPCCLLVGTMYWVIKGAVEETAQQQLAYIMKNRIGQLQDWVAQRTREVKVLSEAPSIVQGLRDHAAATAPRQDETTTPPAPARPEGESREVLTRAVERFASVLEYPNILVFDAKNHLLVQTDKSFPLSGNINESSLRDTALATAINEASARRAVTLAPPQRLPGDRDGPFRIFLAAPVQDTDKLLGVIVIRLSDRELDAVFENYEGLGETGDYYLGLQVPGTKQFAMLAPLRHDVKGEARSRLYAMDGPDATAMQKAIAGDSGFGPAVDYRGVATVAQWDKEPRLGVGIVVEKDRDEAYTWVSFFRWVGLGLIGLTAIFVVPVAIWVAKTLADPVQQAMGLAERVAAGDLTADVENRYTGEHGKLVASVKGMSTHLRSLIGHIQQSIVTLMSTATEFAATSREQQATVQEYGKSTVQVATAVNQISATSQSLLKTMREINTSANEAKELASSGQSSLSDMQTTMQHLADSTGSISGRLSVISERANNINLVVTTITKVADQTNLLSINAAIEAEKAGEYGRGFLVVAREIRRLADQTANATLDIERIVKEMQQSVSAGVMEMDKFNDQVRSGVSDVDRIGEQLNQIIRAVQVLLPRFDLVSEGMAAQSQGADQIRDAMGQLSEGASQTTESLREFNKATEQLREAVLNLKEDISKFTT